MIASIDQLLIKSIYKKRKRNSNKRDYGHALIISGSKGMAGAAVICVKACLRSGVGLATVNLPESERSIVHTVVPEAIVQPRETKEISFTKYNAIGIGPGLGLSPASQKLVLEVLSGYTKPLVIDADAINIIAKNKNYLQKIPKQSILTPHAKEFDRLFGNHESFKKRIITAKRITKETGLIIVLKHFKTLIFSANAVFENTTGNAGMAKGGSGDALTGILTAFLAQGYKPLDAAKIGVFLHGLAADLTLNQQSLETMLATDIIDHFGDAFKFINKKTTS